MNAKCSLVFSIVVILALLLLLSSCSAAQQLIGVGVSDEGNTGVMSDIYGYSGLPECEPTGATPLNDPSKVGSGWLWKTGNLWEFKVNSNGCNLIFEGRIVPGEEIHRVIVLRSQNGENTEFIKDGVFKYSEGSIWALPRSKNIEDLGGKNPEAMKLVNDKRAVQQAAEYDWLITVYFIDGSTMDFPPGEKWANMSEQNHCAFSEPVKIPIHGEKVPGQNRFSAAIGATNCFTVAWIDGSKTPEIWTGQRDAADKVLYTKIEAYLMPVKWTKTEIDNWAASH